ncbi:MAG: L-seryl-tRNA(Sec) selenium transferase [Arcobacteraceae bacterium]
MSLLKSIPKVDKFIQNKAFEQLSLPLVTPLCKEVINQLREDILNQTLTQFKEEDLVDTVLKAYEKITQPSLKTVLNATGVIVHTNLGRSLIAETIFDKVKNIATHYNNLEYDLQKGKRGERYEHISKVICQYLGCEDVLIVNNNASAVFLILNTFAKNKEVLVSRGELVEIGGSFRVPDVMAQSGAILKEIGTTNKTHLKDYQNAITPNSAMLMKVHKSNYSIEGFASEVGIEDMIKTAQEHHLIDYYDMGSGHFVDLPYGLDKDEPSVLKIMQHNPCLLSFSGDKLLGSVQAGIIVGQKKYIEALKKNQLLRMLRVDKLTLALLEESIKALLLGNIHEIPTLKMLFTPIEVLKQRAMLIQKNIGNLCQCELKETQTLIGGGTTPNKKIPTIALSISFKGLKPNKIEQCFRSYNIIGRIEDEQFLLDFRTLLEEELPSLEQCIKEVLHD